jgi:hypothetical protein
VTAPQLSASTASKCERSDPATSSASALLGDGVRTATVTTDSPSQLLVLFGTEFRRLQQEHPEIAARIESGLREIAQAA